MLAVLILLLALSPAHRIDQTKAAASDNKTTKEETQQTQSSASANGSEENKDTTKKNNDGRKEPSYWQKVISPEVLPNWILMILGIVGAIIAFVTLGFIYWQSKDTQRALHWAKRSAIAAKKSADAALLNAQAIVNAERAWIDGAFKKVKDNDAGWEDITSFPHQLRIINRGRTPAYIAAVELEWGAVGLELTTLPDYLGNKSIQEINIFLPPSRIPRKVTVLDMASAVSNSDWLKILAGQKTGVVKAVIKYWDVISRENRETSLVYSYSTTTASFERLNWLNVYK